ncbi:hypothetical protein M3212_05335 [Alkalihalobacillus oceani]|nr:hypothetical protein [Halalkalibacter oceani]MCM3760212.1 hypothetical protein [Halalkalibacter oceani]
MKQKAMDALDKPKRVGKNLMQAMLVFAAMDQKISQLAPALKKHTSSSVTNPKETSFVYGLKNPVTAGFFS